MRTAAQLQVVQIDDDIETQVGGGRMQFWHDDELRWFDLGVVIELTEERMGRMPGNVRRRLVSEWEVVR